MAKQTKTVARKKTTAKKTDRNVFGKEDAKANGKKARRKNGKGKTKDGNRNVCEAGEKTETAKNFNKVKRACCRTGFFESKTYVCEADDDSTTPKQPRYAR